MSQVKVLSLRMPTILKSSLFVSVFLVLNILANFAVEAGLAAILGASSEMDVYLAGVVLPEYLILLLQAGIQFSLVPVIVKQLHAGNVKHVFGLIDTTLAALAFCFLVIWALGALFHGHLALLLAPGFSTGQTEALAGLLPTIIPGALFRVATLTLASYFYARRKFLLPASAPVIGASVQFIIILLTVPEFRADAAGGAFVSNFFIQFLILFIAFQRQRTTPININFALPVFKKTLQAIWPLLLGAVFFRALFLVDRFIASGFEEGSITRLTYATKIVIVLITTGAGGLVTVVFPELSAMIANKQWARIQALNHRSLTAVVFVVLFFWLVMLYFGGTWIKLFLERGAFTAADAKAVASLVVILGGMLIFGAMGAFMSNLFYAAEDTRTPAIIGFCGFWISTALKFFLAQRMEIHGIAIATTIIYSMNLIVMIWLLQRKAPFFDFRQFAIDGVKIFCAVIAAGSVFWAGSAFINISPLTKALFVSIAAGAVYLVVAVILKLSVVEIILRRIGIFDKQSHFL